MGSVCQIIVQTYYGMIIANVQWFGLRVGKQVAHPTQRDIMGRLIFMSSGCHLERSREL